MSQRVRDGIEVPCRQNAHADTGGNGGADCGSARAFEDRELIDPGIAQSLRGGGPIVAGFAEADDRQWSERVDHGLALKLPRWLLAPKHPLSTQTAMLLDDRRIQLAFEKPPFEARAGIDDDFKTDLRVDAPEPRQRDRQSLGDNIIGTSEADPTLEIRLPKAIDRLVMHQQDTFGIGMKVIQYVSKR